MYEYISGRLAETSLTQAIIDVAGIGYRVHTTQTSLNSVGIGENVTFYTHLHVREDIFDLYGFATREERSAFEMLLSISGVGPKAALNVLSQLAPSQLAMAIISGDNKAITKVNGIGPKMASRIVLELKDKVAKDFEYVKAIDFTSAPTSQNDAISALMVLGYSAESAAEAVSGLEGTTEEVIKKALMNGVKK